MMFSGRTLVCDKRRAVPAVAPGIEKPVTEFTAPCFTGGTYNKDAG